jgi:hypothetical protein
MMAVLVGVMMMAVPGRGAWIGKRSTGCLGGGQGILRREGNQQDGRQAQKN